MILPTQYQPLAPEEFIGNDAQTTARMLQRIVSDARTAGNHPIKLLFNGEPGIGKTSLARYLIHLLGCHPQHSVRKFNGTQVKIETVEDIARDLHYKDLFGNYRVIQIEEADFIPTVAQARFLTLLDDLPPGCAVACTSNCKLADFQKRFQTRFKVFELEPPAPSDITALLRRWPADPRAITHISTFACGNVRQALNDLESALQSSPLKVAA
jgi:replication-associated recombination protein RarA